MADVLTLEEAFTNISKVENEIRKGEIVVLPIENGYVYLADAFNRSAVRKINQFRGNQEGVSLGVLISQVKALSGITKYVPETMKLLTEKYWPGLLTLYVQPNPALNWDLGDGGSLGEFAVRIPSSELVQLLAKNIGPLVFASASKLGDGPALNLDSIGAMPGELSLLIDGGTINEIKLSTVVRAKVIGDSELEVVRIGAISLEELAGILPEITLASTN
jgi:tRNA threonylcarbamoyl adenosine modification protein (Sua5/YciO/YrdC/YwlC family)